MTRHPRTAIRAGVSGTALALLLLTVAAASCGDNGEHPASQESPTPAGQTPAAATRSPTPGTLREVTRERDGVRLTLSVGRDSYEPGDKVEVRVAVENSGSMPVELSQPDSPLTVELFSDLAGAQILTPEEGGQPVETSLAPGRSLRASYVWDQMLDTRPTAVQAPPGRYDIRASFPFKPPPWRGAEEISLNAAVSFELRGGRPIVSQVEAIRTAISAPEVKAWFEGRGAQLACVQGTAGFYYAANVEMESVTPGLEAIYQVHLQQGLPICGLSVEGDYWRVTFLHAEGAPPTRVTALVNLYDGAFPPPAGEESGAGPSPRG